MKNVFSFPKLTIHPSFLIYLGFLYMLKGIELVIGLLMALLAHESAHLLMGSLFKNRYEKIELTPFGGMISCQAGQSDTKGIKGILIAMAGPAANYALLLFLCTRRTFLQTEIGKALFVANTSMLFINLLPVLPLDGGRIVFSIGYYFFPVSRLISVLGALGSLTGGGMIALSLWGIWISQKLNLTLMVFGCYMIFLSKREASQLLLANRYIALSEKKVDERTMGPLKLYQVHTDQTLISLLPSLIQDERRIYVTKTKGELCFFEELELIDAILAYPQHTLSDVMKQRSDQNCKTFC